jgi:Protein of unknown function (DUF2795)
LQLVEYAERNRGRVSEPDILIETITELSDTQFENMADVEKALAEIR